MEEDGQQFRNYVKYNAVFAVIAIHGWNWMFLIGMPAVVLIGIIRLLCSPCQVAFMDNDENVIVAIADSIFYTGQVE